MINSLVGSDVNRYAELFVSMGKKDIGLLSIFENFYGDDDSLDIFRSITLIVVSRFSSNPSLYFAVIGVFFGFFYSRVMWFVLNRMDVKFDFFQTLFFLTLIFIMPFYDLQFVRFSTATIVFLYFALPYFYENKKRYIVYSALSLLIHFSFIFPLAVLVLYSFLPKKLNIFFIIFIISIFFAEVKLSFLTEFMQNNLPAVFQTKVESYGNEDYALSIEEDSQALNWYITYRFLLISYVNYAMIIYLFVYFRQDIIKNKIYNQALCFILFFYSLSNIIAVMPSGSRFVSVSQKFLWIFICLYFFASERKMDFNKLLKYTCVPVLLLYIITGFRYAADTFGITMVIGNPITMFFNTDEVPIIDFIK